MMASAIDLEKSVHHWGNKIFDLIDDARPPSFFSRKGMNSALMQWAMKDERFKTQLFRFVDVLPALKTPAEIARHVKEYFRDEELPAGFRLGAGATVLTSLFSSTIRNQVTAMARQFMLGNDEHEIARALKELHEGNIGFTLDVLGETVVSEAEADRYAGQYAKLLQFMAPQLQSWKHICACNETPRGPVPGLNLSVKISAFYSQINPADPETALAKISERLRPVLRLASELGAFINFDMEHYALKDLTLELFKRLLSEKEFAEGPPCGIAMQAYLRSTEPDLEQLIAWARRSNRRVTVRLVKGAYWDYEHAIANQRHWPAPVFAHKAETDASYERLSTKLLQNLEVIDSAFGTHNVRSIAYALTQAERLGIDPRSFEFQMLHGMAEPIKEAVLKLGLRLREYCPVGEFLPGMAYLVRRLLENTSNEGFLAQKFQQGIDREHLLRMPQDVAAPRQSAAEHVHDSAFHNEPHLDFAISENRERMRKALQELRARLGRKHPLVIGGREIKTADWLPSLNPANQHEVIGFAAQAEISHAEVALAAAGEAQPAWGRTPADERARKLEGVAELMCRDRFDLCALEILEAGKNWSEADADVAEAIDFCRFYAATMRDLAQPHLTQRVLGESNVQHWWPRGVGVIIAPWNFPLAILTGMASAAIVTGNAILLKPSDQTPVIASRLMELFTEAGIPDGVANLLSGPGSTVGSHLVAHPHVDFIAFTGSKEVGLKIWEMAGQTRPGQANLKKVVCEMGGKNCIIIDSDADLDESVVGCIASAFGYQGQKCSALSRLIVLEDRYDEFTDRLVAASQSMLVGPAEKPGTSLGPVISKAAQQRILKLIESGRSEAKSLWQGKVPDDPNACYVPPTIFSEVPAASFLFREEIFGPVLAVSRAKDFDEALQLANQSEFALTAGLYSRSPANISRAKEDLTCGNLYINRTITGAIVERQPFGGFKMSGGGTKAGGREYLQNFLVPRVVSENLMRRGFSADA